MTTDPISFLQLLNLEFRQNDSTSWDMFDMTVHMVQVFRLCACARACMYGVGVSACVSVCVRACACACVCVRVGADELGADAQANCQPDRVGDSGTHNSKGFASAQGNGGFTVHTAACRASPATAHQCSAPTNAGRHPPVQGIKSMQGGTHQCRA